MVSLPASDMVPINLLSISGCAQGPSANYGRQAGVVSLAAGQTQRVWIGAAYRLLRVCNDLESNGTAVVVINGRQPITLGPGICTEDYGNTIDVDNHSASAVTIAYRTIFGPIFEPPHF